MVDIVADVLTVKDSDSRPTLEMSIEDINSASGQPTSDLQFDQYQASEFDDAERIEFHLDFLDPNGPNIRIVDGREATWDSQADTISVDLERSDTARVGQYLFEWVLIYDVDVTNLDEATEVNTVPDVGFFGLTVENPTKRSLVAEDEPDRSVAHIWFGQQSDTPTDSEIGSGNTALYAKDDGLLYTRPHGGTESQVGSGGGGSPGGSDTQLQYNNGGAFGGISGYTFDDAAGTLTGVPSIDATLSLADQAASPSANGQIQLNGTDIEVFSGGNVRNLTNVGSGGGSAIEVAEDGTSLTTDVSLIDVLGGLTASEPATDEIDLTVNESEVDHNSLQNHVANEHIDHSSVSVSGTGSLSGGGDLTSSRTLDVADDGIDTAEIAQGAVTEAKLDVTDTPSDGEILSWNNSQTQFEWVAQSSGSSSSVIESPNGQLQAVELQDSANSDSGNNEYTEIAEYVASSETITIYRWGGFVISDDNQTTGTALEVSLLQQDGTVVQSATTADNSASGGITGASYSPSSDEVVRMRVTNTTGEDVNSAGGYFGYEVV